MILYVTDKKAKIVDNINLFFVLNMGFNMLGDTATIFDCLFDGV
jgi:hypothetical protein